MNKNQSTVRSLHADKGERGTREQGRLLWKGTAPRRGRITKGTYRNVELNVSHRMRVYFLYVPRAR